MEPTSGSPAARSSSPSSASITLALSPLFAWIGAYLFAVLQHFLVMIFVMPRKDYDAILLAYAHASTLALLGRVTILGYLASLYGPYATMPGMRESHGTSTARALLVILVPSLVFLANTDWTLWPGTRRSVLSRPL